MLPSKYMTTINKYFCIKMIFLDFLKVKILGKYAPKRTKLHNSKKKFRGSMPPNPPQQTHGYATRRIKISLYKTLYGKKK